MTCSLPKRGYYGIRRRLAATITSSLQRHQTFKENSNRDVYPLEEKVNEFLLKMAEKHGIKVIATNGVHFTFEDDAEAHDRLIRVSMQKRFNEPRLHYTKQEWLKSTEEMNKIFAGVPQALQNTNEILDKIEFYSIDHGPIMPNFAIPEEFGTEEEYRQRLTEEDLFNEFTQDENGNVVLSKEDADKKIKRLGGYDKLYRIKFEADYLEKLTWEGAKERYGDPLTDDVKERLKFEPVYNEDDGFPRLLPYRARLHQCRQEATWRQCGSGSWFGCRKRGGILSGYNADRPHQI